MSDGPPIKHAMTRPEVVLILYTTRYRKGGPRFERAAITMEDEKRAEHPACRVERRPVESKADFLAAVEAVREAAERIVEFHFIGHSGMYGIMFGTDKWPEQFSPHEWRQMRIPFAEGARFYFHACRTGRWFAPFVARTLGVTTYGHYWYTTISREPGRFRWLAFAPKVTDEIYVISCPGRKSHGLPGSIRKYLSRPRAFPLLEFAAPEPGDTRQAAVDASYDSIAELYARTFEDIGAREDEWRWLNRALGDLVGRRILDVGCGNGALLAKLRESRGGGFSGVGVDASPKMVEMALRRCAKLQGLSFETIDGPSLPFADDSFDCVTSLLSFRYLDWDPMLQEILRVLKPGGELFVVDMVAAPARMREVPKLLWDKLKAYRQRLRAPAYHRALLTLVRDERWRRMLQYNPIRAEHELTWYLESRFPGARTVVINIGWTSRILAFRTGAVTTKRLAPMRYP